MVEKKASGKKKPIKMKRVDEQSEAEVISDEEVVKMTVRQPVKTGGGVIVASGDEDEIVAPTAESAPTPHVDLSRGTVSVSPPEMEEVSYEEWAADQAVAVASPDTAVSATPNEVLQTIVGESKAFAEKVLEGMKADRQITEYRLMPMGMPMTMDVKPGRVQALMDATGKVITVEVS